MNDVMGLILAYSNSKSMGELSVPRTTSSIPFGGNYRAIDFLLSNMVNAGATDVGIAVREGYQSLLDHLGSGKDWELSRKLGGLVLLPPYGYNQSRMASGYDASFKGKMSALVNILDYITQTRKKYVIMGDGDVILNIKLEPIIEKHIESGADITVVCSHPVGEATRGIYITPGERNKVVGLTTYPQTAGQYESTGIYILEKKVLLDLIDYSIMNDMAYFEREVLRTMLDKMDVRYHVFDGYVAKLQTVENYFKSSMELLDVRIRADLFDRENPIYTRIRDYMATYYGDVSEVTNSLVADGCIIEGKVENSILFRGVRVGSGAVVRNSIIMPNCVIGANSFMNYIIADKNVRVIDDSMVVGSTKYPVVVSKNHTV